MHSYFFPFGRLDRTLADHLTRWLGPVHLITPTPLVENELRKLVDSGLINLCHPTAELESQINQHWELLKNWRFAHQGMTAQDLHDIAARTPFYEPDHTHQLRDEIRQGARSVNVSPPGKTDYLFQAWVLLKAAYDYDLQNARIGQHLREADEQHQGVMEFLKGVPQHRNPQPKKVVSDNTYGADQGLWKPILRLKSWIRVYLQQCITTADEPELFFVTTSSIILEQMQSRMEAETAWHHKMHLDLGHDDPHQAATAAQLQDRLSQLTLSQNPEPVWQDLVQWSATRFLKPGSVHLDLWVVPNLPPHRFWSSLFPDTRGETGAKIQPESPNHTLLGLFSPA